MSDLGLRRDVILADLSKDVHFNGNIRDDITAFLLHHGCPKTVGHSAQVVAEARWLADKFGADKLSVETAAWLHDISAVFPTHQQAEIARELGVEVLPEEVAVPMILHQKLSVVIARDVFGIDDEAVLSAIGCHTTLKANASLLDKVVFLADKMSWDQPASPPYLQELLTAVERSLDQAVLCYLDYLWQRRDTLPVVHPWLVEAHQQLSEAT